MPGLRLLHQLVRAYHMADLGLYLPQTIRHFLSNTDTIDISNSIQLPSNHYVSLPAALILFIHNTHNQIHTNNNNNNNSQSVSVAIDTLGVILGSSSCHNLNVYGESAMGDIEVVSSAADVLMDYLHYQIVTISNTSSVHHSEHNGQILDLIGQVKAVLQNEAGRACLEKRIRNVDASLLSNREIIGYSRYAVHLLNLNTTTDKDKIKTVKHIVKTVVTRVDKTPSMASQ